MNVRCIIDYSATKVRSSSPDRDHCMMNASLLSPDPSSLQDEEQERVFDTGPGAVTAEGAALLLPKHRDKEMNLLPHSALST